MGIDGIARLLKWRMRQGVGVQAGMMVVMIVHMLVVAYTGCCCVGCCVNELCE